MFKPNTLYYSDGYKVGHKRMLAPGTTRLYGTWIPRSLKHAPKGITKIVSFGQQLTVKWLHDEFTENFFKLPLEDAMQFPEDMKLYLGMDYDGEHFKQLHKLQYLPIKIKSLPEGIETDPNIPHMTFINTVDGFAWLTLYLETLISSLAWKSATSATLALQYKRNATEWVMKTDPDQAFLIPFLCHDFSARGLDPFSMLSSGLGHATSFRGSDTLICIPGARYFYNEPKDQVCINSVNASEHSVSTTKIFTVGEKQMIIDWLKEFPTGILSIVADTFDLWKLLVEYLADPEVKALILARDGKLVIRPDSGDPVDIICGKLYPIIEDGIDYSEIPAFFNYKSTNYANKFTEYHIGGQLREKTIDIARKDSKIGLLSKDSFKETYDRGWFYKLYEAEKIGVIETLWNIFGGTINKQGFKVLDSHIGAIYGDSITLDRQVQIYSRLANKGFASTNIVLGVGSFTYQYNTRDTLGFAAKGAWFEINENKLNPTGWMDDAYPKLKSYDIYKDPVTDDGTKKSLKGLCAVYDYASDSEAKIYVKEQCTWEEESQGILRIIYEDGNFHNQTTLQEIRERLKV